MGKLAERTSGGTRLQPKETATVKQLIEEGEIDADEVIYEVTSSGQRKLNKGDAVEPGKKYGVVPSNDVGVT